ncbi:MAG: ABC transporter ATP-binding protein [Candidatus Bathyarchaeia archaeon]
MPLLDVEHLKVYFETMRGYVKAVDDISFHVEKGEAMGLAGESGCGKTTTALAILKILPPNGKIVDGKVIFNGIDLTKLNEEEMRNKIRWKGISLIFQGAMNALNPIKKVGDQILEAIRLHEREISKEEAMERAAKLFQLVGIEPSRLNNYPHEFSGGMRQRAMIAMALASNPEVVIADEPATALDVIVAAQVLKLLRELKVKLGISIILITHDLSIIADTCDKTAIMYAGKIVEYGEVRDIFKKPLHPYTQGLIRSFPNIKGQRTKLISIPGNPPDLLKPPLGCRFHPRCPYAIPLCNKKEPEFLEVEKSHIVACHLIK